MTIGNQPVNSGVMWGTITPEDSPMRSHIQGVFILLFVAIALMILARMAAPVVQDAFGDNGAIVAESAEVVDVVDLADGSVSADADLTGEEVAILQANLAEQGFDPGPIDGILGRGTRDAISAAISEYKLDVNSSDRAVFNYLESLSEALKAAAAATSDLSEG